MNMRMATVSNKKARARLRVLSNAGGALALVLAGAVWMAAGKVSAADDEFVKSPLELIAGKTATIRGCGQDLSRVECEALVATIMSGKGVNIVEPVEIIPDRSSRRFLEIGGRCPPTGADIRGDPYLPFEIDMEGGQGIPFGPFKVFDISSINSYWDGALIVTAEGYDFEDASMSTGINLAWKMYTVVTDVYQSCPITTLGGMYTTSRDRPLTTLRGDALIRIGDSVYLLQVEELGPGWAQYRAHLRELTAAPRTPEESKALGRRSARFSVR